MHLTNEIKWNDVKCNIIQLISPPLLFVPPSTQLPYSRSFTSSLTIILLSSCTTHTSRNLQAIFFRQIVAAINHFNETHGIVSVPDFLLLSDGENVPSPRLCLVCDKTALINTHIHTHFSRFISLASQIRNKREEENHCHPPC